MEQQKLLCVVAGGHTFGIEVGLVRGVDRPARWARLPWVPDYVRGISEVSGVVVAVLDLASRLGLPPGEARATQGTVLVEAAEPVALEVEGIEGVRTIDPAWVTDLGERGRRAGVTGRLPDGVLVLAIDPVADGRPLLGLAEALASEAPGSEEVT